MAVPMLLFLLPGVATPAPATAVPLLAPTVIEQPADPAGALERQARRAMATGDNREAARVYRELREKYPRSSYTPDAFYWEAFALFRLGAESDLRRALLALEEQRERFPKAPSREDAAALATRIEGALARFGDAASARVIVGKAERAEAPARAERPERMERPERPERPERAERPERGPKDGCQEATEAEDERVAALNALMQMDADRALPVLRKVMARRDACSVSLRRKAVFLISQKRSADASALLIEAVRNDPDSDVREQAAFWLGQSGSEEAVTVLGELVRSSRDVDVRRKAVFALAQTKSEKASAALRDVALDDGAAEELRKDAIFWLGQMYRGSAVAELSGLYAKLLTDELKDQVLFAVSQAKSAASAAFLRDVARNANEEMRRRESAVFWYGQSNGSADDLMAIYKGETAVPLRDKVIFALSQKRRDPRAVDHLMTIARTEKNPELRKSAVFWLSQTKDPRVGAFLQELIDR